MDKNQYKAEINAITAKGQAEYLAKRAPIVNRRYEFLKEKYLSQYALFAACATGFVGRYEEAADRLFHELPA